MLLHTRRRDITKKFWRKHDFGRRIQSGNVATIHPKHNAWPMSMRSGGSMLTRTSKVA